MISNIFCQGLIAFQLYVYKKNDKEYLKNKASGYQYLMDSCVI